MIFGLNHHQWFAMKLQAVDMGLERLDNTLDARGEGLERADEYQTLMILSDPQHTIIS